MMGKRAKQGIQWPLPPAGKARERAVNKGGDLFFDKGCWKCHKLGDEMLPGQMDTQRTGPDLKGIGARLKMDQRPCYGDQRFPLRCAAQHGTAAERRQPLLKT